MDSWPGNKHIFFDRLSPGCGAAVATAIAEIMADGLSVQQMNLLANFIGAIAQTLSYIASQQQFNEANNAPPVTGIIA